MYFKENISVIILFLIMNSFIVLVGLVDSGIPNVSIIYLVLFNLLILVIYLAWDFNRKRTFSKEFDGLKTLNDMEGINKPHVNAQKQVYEKLDELRTYHQTLLEEEAGKTKENLDELTRFIHDMKMPVTTMKLMIDDLEGTDHDKLASEWTRLNNLLNEVLYLQRLPNIKNDLYIERLNINDLVKRSILKLRSICIRKNIGFDVNFQTDYIYSDKKWLQFVIDQILANCVKYSSDNDIVIVGIMEDEHFKLSVTDFGRGIKAKDIDNIFQAGFTSTSDHDDDQSTGMGLYLSKEVCDILNIKLTAQSEYQEYTTMTLSFNKANNFSNITMK